MNRTCTDIGIIFCCCILVTSMGVFGRPISIDYLKENGKTKFNKISNSGSSLLPGSPDVFPFVNVSSADLFRKSFHSASDRVNKYKSQANSSLTNTPEYMLELYNKLSKHKPFLHNSNIIRSFINLQPKDNKGTNSDPVGARVHSLTFNISTLNQQESINLAELRLYTLIKHDQTSFTGVRRFVSIFEVLNITNGHKTREKYNYITSKYIHSVTNAWESFDVTAALRRSLKHRSSIERLEVRIRSLFTPIASDNLDINDNPNDSKQPILVVYSNDNSARHEHSVDRHQLVMNSLTSQAELSSKYSTPLAGNFDTTYTGTHNSFSKRERVKRSRLKNAICRKRSMYVNFADIGFDWIIAPRGYQAYQCAGRCYFPLSDQMHPTKHAIIQLIMHAVYPRRATKVCCVPTKLEPISILYVDEYGVVTYKYSYDGMVVSECGCR